MQYQRIADTLSASVFKIALPVELLEDVPLHSAEWISGGCKAETAEKEMDETTMQKTIWRTKY